MDEFKGKRISKYVDEWRKLPHYNRINDWVKGVEIEF